MTAISLLKKAYVVETSRIVCAMFINPFMHGCEYIRLGGAILIAW